MKAMLSHEIGGPETLRLEEVETPKPGPGEVLIGVKAAGVNFPDTLIIRDLYQFKPPRPFAPGGEVSGVIEEIGEGVTHLSIGDRVSVMSLSGGFATHIVQKAEQVMKIPDAMPFEEAAAFLLTYATSYYALHSCGHIAQGDTVLVLGAAGGIGVSAIELAKAAGARVIAAVSSEEKATFCRELGADETLVYPRHMDKDAQKALASAIKEAAGKDGVDIVYDPVGGDYAEPALRSMGWMGRYLVVGFTAGIPKLPLNLPLLKNCAIQGVFWGAFTMRDPQGYAAQVKSLVELYNNGKIRPRISETFPLERAADALKLIEDRKVQGKIVLTI